MSYMLVHFKIQDLSRWKTAFNDARDMRKDAGEKSYHIFKSTDDKNEMIVIQEWESTSKAKKFARSKELRKCMEKAGIVGRPDMLFLEELNL